MKRPFLTAGLSLFFSIIASELFCGFSKTVLVFVSAAACFLWSVILLFCRLTGKSLKKSLILAVSTVILFVSVGSFSWSVGRNALESKAQSALIAENDVYTISDTICKPVKSGYLTTVVSASSGAKIQVYTYEPFSARPGDIFNGKLRFYEDDDISLYEISESISLTATAVSGYEIRKTEGRSFQRLVYTVTAAITENLKRNAGSDSGLLRGLLLGDRSGLSYEEQDFLKKAGIYHVCAVSGLHVSVLAAFIILVLNFFEIKNRILKTVLTILFLFLLTTLCGFTPSSVRAVFMAGVASLGQVFFRRSDTLNSLGFALTVILLISPLSAFSASLLLSFAATFGIVLAATPMTTGIITFIFRKTGHKAGKFLISAVQIFSLSVSATAFTLPVTAFFFDTASACGIISNLLIITPATLLFVFTLLLSVFGFVPLFGSVVAILSGICRIGVRYIMSVSEFFSLSDLSSLPVNVQSLICGLIVALIAASAYLFKTRGKKSKKKQTKRALYAVAAAICTFLIVVFGGSFFTKSVTPPDDLYHFSFIDVGQGMGSVLVHGDSAIVIDCGGTKNAARNMTAFLRKRGVTEISCVIISHLHSDHANALSDFAGDWNLEEIMIPYTDGEEYLYDEIMGIVEDEKAVLTVLEEDSVRVLDDCYLSILTHHLDPTSGDQNENSLVVIAKIGQISSMFTGDITSAAEKRLISEYGDLLKCDIFGVPHHGSKNSSSALFLDFVRPEWSIVSVGENEYGHPTEEAMNRLAGCGSKILTTRNEGTIDISTDGRRIEMAFGD